MKNKDKSVNFDQFENLTDVEISSSGSDFENVTFDLEFDAIPSIESTQEITDTSTDIQGNENFTIEINMDSEGEPDKESESEFYSTQSTYEETDEETEPNIDLYTEPDNESANDISVINDSDDDNIDKGAIEGINVSEVDIDVDSEPIIPTDEEETIDEGAFEYTGKPLSETLDETDTKASNQKEEKTKSTNEESNSIITTNGEFVQANTNEKCFEFQYIACKQLQPSNIRLRKGKSDSDIAALALSVQKLGLLVPIVVTPTATKGTYLIIDGYRRFLAARKCGLKTIPCLINTKVKTEDAIFVEPLCNQFTAYQMQEIIDGIKYYETEKGITNPATLECLFQLETGEYLKLKDVLGDNDPDIMDKLLSGKLTIEQAYNKLKQKRAKQTKAEKELEKTKAMFNTEGDSGNGDLEIKDLGEKADIDTSLSEQEIADLGDTPNMLDVENKEVEELLEEGDQIKGFEDKVQKVGERECVDPAMRKAVMARDNNTCQCCLEGGESYVDVNDFHHILPVFLGGADTVDNAECLCVKCHKLVHLHARGQLHLPNLDTLTEADKDKFKRIIARGNYIRKGMETKGMKLEAYKKKDEINKIGRQLPGTKNTVS